MASGGDAQQLLQHQGVQLGQVQPPLPLGELGQRLGNRLRLGGKQVVAQFGDRDKSRTRLARQQPGQAGRVLCVDQCECQKTSSPAR